MVSIALAGGATLAVTIAGTLLSTLAFVAARSAVFAFAAIAAFVAATITTGFATSWLATIGVFVAVKVVKTHADHGCYQYAEQ